jgi:DNA polymerase I-like protein with 3'-5' exonuclease and polymerase domains
MWDFYQQIWSPFAVVLADMEEYGIKIDTKYLEEIEPIALKDKQEKVDKREREREREREKRREFF